MAADHRFVVFLVKREDATYIRGPFCNSLCTSHNIALHDVVSFILIKKTEEYDQFEEDVQEEKPVDRAEYVFQMKSHNTNGDIKEFRYIPGMCVVSHQMWLPYGIIILILIAFYMIDFATCGFQH